MRGWLLVRVVIAVGVAVAGWLLGVIPVLPRDWQPRAPVVALVIVLLLYLAAEYLHGIAGRKETQAYRDHVSDLQGFARSAREVIEMRQQSMIVWVDIGQPLGLAFKAHFGEVAGLIDQWNQLAAGWTDVVAEFMKAFAAETARLNLVNSGFTAVLQGSILGWIDISRLTWLVQGGKLLMSLDSTWEITTLPATEHETDRLLTSLWESLTHVKDIPAVSEWSRRMRETAELWHPLRDELAAVEVTHDPPGRCPYCPK